MANYNRLEVVQVMRSNGLVPLFYNSDINTCKKIVKACYDGGSRILEFTNRGDMAYKIFEELLIYVSKNCPGMVLGVGSLTDASSASLYIQIGANFIITPVLREDIVSICNRRKVFWSAGCGTLTEICRAEELGCEVVKLFPGGIYGPDFVKAIKGPQPWTYIMPTGGVSNDKKNLLEWFNSGVFCVGMGSKLISKEIIESNNYKKLSKDVSNVLSIINSIR
tara:strand:+ start:651 stop:1316 length:666 start_codon:yes stop_codon:yes gene_type:complete